MYDMYPDFNDAPHNHPRIIGLSGYATSGKDSTAEVLVRLYGYERVAFADKLKRFVSDVGGIVFQKNSDTVRVPELVSAMGDTEAKKSYPEYRRLLINTGSAAREHFGEDVWIDAAFASLPDRPVVVTDVRFQNEAKRIKKMGGVIFRIHRPGVGPVSDHISEHDLDNWQFDGVILNDGDLVDLEGEVQNVLGDLG